MYVSMVKLTFDFRQNYICGTYIVNMTKLTFDIITNPSQMCVKSNNICYIHLHAVEMQVNCYLQHIYTQSQICPQIYYTFALM